MKHTSPIPSARVLTRTGFLALALALPCSSALAQRYGGTWDERWGVEGFQPSMALGAAIVGIADVDGDLVPDVVFSAPRADTLTHVDNGIVMCHSGATGSWIWTHDGRSDGELRGRAMAPAGDWNGDGIADVLVGSPLYDPLPKVDAGLVKILDGATGVDIFTAPGPVSGDRFGAALAGDFDYDGDGRVDMLVGSPGASFGGADAGRVTLIAGGSGGPVWNFDGMASERAGSSVAHLGDIDGDGKPDFVVGGPDSSPGGIPDAGRVWVLSGATGSVIRTHDGTEPAGRLGESVAAGSDVDGDGIPDYLIGAPGEPTATLSDAGRVRVISGATGLVLWQIEGERNADRLGTLVAMPGDYNADGIGDVAASGVGAAMRGFVQLHDGKSGMRFQVLPGANAGDRYGSAIANVGDLDGSGEAELAIGSRTEDTVFGSDAGRMHVLGFEPCLIASGSSISASAGGSITFTLDFPDRAGGMRFALLGSGTGQGPTYANGVAVPLTPDTLFARLASGRPPKSFVNPYGFLDASGDGASSVVLPAGSPSSLVGRTFWVGAVTYVPPGAVEIASVSSGVTVTS